MQSQMAKPVSIFRILGENHIFTILMAAEEPTLKGPKHEIFESGFFYTNQRHMVR